MKGFVWRKIWRGIKVGMILYIAFVLLSVTVPYLFPPAISNQEQMLMKDKKFSSDIPGGDRALLVEAPHDAFNIRIRMIQSAQHSIDIAYHTFQKGITEDALCYELSEASRRGVRIRIILDGKVGVLDRDVKAQLEKLHSLKNVTVKMYNPVNILKPWQWQVLLHDKMMLVDQQYLLLGGRNNGDAYFNPPDYDGKVVYDRDAFIWNNDRSLSSVMPEAKDYFQTLWRQKENKIGKRMTADAVYWESLSKKAGHFCQDYPQMMKKTFADYLDQTVETRKVTLIVNPVKASAKAPIVAGYMAQAAENAHSEVIVQTPYATGNKDLLKTLKTVSDHTDLLVQTNSLASSPNYPAFSNYYYQRKKFLKTGAQIYEYQGAGSIHGKSMITDERFSFVGSLNLDNRSFYIDTESMLVIDSPAFAHSLKEAVYAYQEKSLKVDENNRYEDSAEVKARKVPASKKAMMFVVSLFSRLLQFLI